MAVLVERGWFINSVKERTAKLSISCLLLLEIKAVNYGSEVTQCLLKLTSKNQSRPAHILSPHCRHLCSDSLRFYGISCVFSISVKLGQVHVSISGWLHRVQKLTFFLHLFYHLRLPPHPHHHCLLPPQSLSLTTI